MAASSLVENERQERLNQIIHQWIDPPIIENDNDYEQDDKNKSNKNDKLMWGWQQAHDALVDLIHSDETLYSTNFPLFLNECKIQKDEKENIHKEKKKKFYYYQDLFRAMVQTCALMLEVTHPSTACPSLKYNKNLYNARITLWQTMETSLQVLCRLVGCLSSTELPQQLGVSCYPLLNALFQEPLIPLDEQERWELWMECQGKQHDAKPLEIKNAPTATCNTIYSEQFIDNGGVEIESRDCMLQIPSQKELRQEEALLIRWAQRPIPTSNPEL